MTKAQRIIAAEDVSRVFDNERIDKLAGELPAHADRQSFAEGIREAARVYARDAREPTVNELHAEIAALYRTADRRQYGRLATLIERLSPKARNLLNGRGDRLGVAVPRVEALRGTQAEKACVVVATLARTGGACMEGRMRPTGRRSRTWQASLHAPERQRHFPRRQAERYFILMLQAAWFDAVGELPSVAVNRQRPSRFAKMAAECFKLAGAPHADVFGLINNVNRQRRIKKAVNHQN